MRVRAHQDGEGPLKGRHLYYRCTDRVLRYPLPPECKERGLNARIADELVWQRMVQLMSSPELMREQVERRMNSIQLRRMHIRQGTSPH